MHQKNRIGGCIRGICNQMTCIRRTALEEVSEEYATKDMHQKNRIGGSIRGVCNKGHASEELYQRHMQSEGLHQKTCTGGCIRGICNERACIRRTALEDVSEEHAIRRHASQEPQWKMYLRNRLERSVAK